MEQYYNAFISYRHAPLDIKIASAIQKQLERFRIPRSIQKSTGIRKIGRVFRDKEELTVTSDLNDIIQDALTHSNYLIVICSTSTRESVWVQREIEFFLRTHTKRQIFTVIADGEPRDVIPKILQFDEKELKTASGTLETVQVPVEPLSCDCRGSLRKARREELPRLAAALLGCSYDDLRRRQRQYRTRRIAAICAAVGLLLSGLLAYFAWSAATIRNNYEKALISQSDYLASEAGKAMENGDRLTAMLLAMEALPSEEKDRPVTCAAVNALIRSTYAYEAPGQDNRKLYAAFPHTGKVKLMGVCEEKHQIATASSNKILTVWDTETKEKLLCRNFDDTIMCLSYAPGGKLLVSAEKLYCYDTDTWQVLWEKDSEYTILYVRYSEAGDWAAIAGLDDICIADLQTGKLLHTMPKQALSEELSDYIENIGVSPDGTHVVFCYNTAVGVWDISSGKVTMTEIEESWLHKIVFLDDRRFALGYLPNDQDSNMKLEANGVSRYLMAPSHGTVLCMDLSAHILWSHELNYSQIGMGSELHSITYRDTEGNETPAVSFYEANICEVYDASDGHLLARIDTVYPVVASEVLKNGLVFVLENGNEVWYPYSLGYPVLSECTVDHLEDALLGQDYYIVSTSAPENVLVYRFGICDESWTPFSDAPVQPEPSAYYPIRSGFLEISDDCILRYYDVEAGKMMWEQPLENSRYNYKFLGADPAEEYALIYCDCFPGAALYRVDLQTGNASIVPLEYESSNLRSRDAVFQNGRLYYIDRDCTGLVCLDMNTSESRLIPFHDTPEEMYFITDLYASEDLNAFLFSNRSSYYFYNGKEFLTVEGEHLPQIAAINKNGSKFALSETENIVIYDAELNELLRIPISGDEPTAMCFHDGYLLVSCSGGKLCRYDENTGEFLGSLHAITRNYGAEDPNPWNFTGQNTLVFQSLHDLTLIDLDSWENIMEVRSCIGYYPEYDKIAVLASHFGSPSEYLPGTYHIYTVEELMEKARSILGNLTLSQAQKDQYGLSD